MIITYVQVTISLILMHKKGQTLNPLRFQYHTRRLQLLRDAYCGGGVYDDDNEGKELKNKISNINSTKTSIDADIMQLTMYRKNAFFLISAISKLMQPFYPQINPLLIQRSIRLRFLNYIKPQVFNIDLKIYAIQFWSVT